MKQRVLPTVVIALSLTVMAPVIEAADSGGCSTDLKKDMIICLDSNSRLLATYRSYDHVMVKRGPRGQLLFVHALEVPVMVHVDVEYGIVTMKSVFKKDGFDHEDTTWDGGPRNGQTDVCTKREGAPRTETFVCVTKTE